MLKSIDPLLGPDLLQILAAMGHGDDIAVVDRNFPAHSVAAGTVTGQVVRLDGVDIPRAVRAILSVMPLDSFVETPAYRMEVVGDPDTVTPVQQAVQSEVDAAEGHSVAMGGIERFAFYEAAGKAFAVVITGEDRPYGCFLFKKGVIFPQ